MHKVEVPLGYDPQLNLFYREDRKSWIIEYYLPVDDEDKPVKTWRTLPKSTKNKKQATTFADRKTQDLLKGLLSEKEFVRIEGSKNREKLTFDQAIEIFLSLPDAEKLERTKSSEESLLKKGVLFFKENFNFIYVNDVKEKHLAEYKEFLLKQAKLRTDHEGQTNALKSMANTEQEKWELDLKLKKTGVAPATARSNFRLMRTFFSKLWKNRKIPENPAAEVEGITLPKHRKAREKTFDLQDVIRILNAPYRHPEGFPIKEFFELKLETGARHEELLCSEWDDFDLKNGVWHLKIKPTCPTPWGVGFRPKCGKARKVPLSERAVQILESIPKRFSVGYIRNDDTPYKANFVFTTRDYRKPHSPNYGGWCRPNSIKTAWAQLLKKAGLPFRGIDKHHLHDLRRLRNEMDRHIHGMSDQERSQKLGHSEKVNKEHYSVEFDQTIVGLTNEIKSLKSKIAMLEVELELEREKSSSNVIHLQKRASN